MADSFYLKSPEIRANCIAYISRLDDADVVVTIKSAKESRSDAQHRLRWLWFSQMAKELAGQGEGRNKEAWNMYYKHKYLPHLLIEQDEDYVSYFNRYKSTCQELTGENLEAYQTNFWSKVISTRDMHVKTMAKWLNLVDDDAMHQWAAQLKTPQDLEWIR